MVSGVPGLFIFIFAAGSALAGTEVVSESTQRWVNQNCQATQSCGLLRTQLTVQKLKLTFPDQSVAWVTRMAESYRTRRQADLEDYGLVQWIRGCRFYSQRQPDGSVQKQRNMLVREFGEMVPFVFPQWTLDSPVPDPLDWGYDSNSENRHGYYSWRKTPGSLDESHFEYFKYAPAPTPELFVHDTPGSAQISQHGMASNVSLQFKTCLFHTKDVSRNMGPGQEIAAKPLQCFDWSSSFIYNHDLGRFESPSGLDPICQSDSPPMN